MSNPTEIKDFIPNAELLRPDSPLRNTGTLYDLLPPDNLGVAATPAPVQAEMERRGIVFHQRERTPDITRELAAELVARERARGRAQVIPNEQAPAPYQPDTPWTAPIHTDTWRAAPTAPPPPEGHVPWGFEERVIRRVSITRLRLLHRQLCNLLLHMDRNHEHEMLTQGVVGRPFDYTIGEFGIKDLALPVPQNPAHVPEAGYPPQTWPHPGDQPPYTGVGHLETTYAMDAGNELRTTDGVYPPIPAPVGNSLTETGPDTLAVPVFAADLSDGELVSAALGLPPAPPPPPPADDGSPF